MKVAFIGASATIAAAVIGPVVTHMLNSSSHLTNTSNIKPETASTFSVVKEKEDNVNDETSSIEFAIETENSELSENSNTKRVQCSVTLKSRIGASNSIQYYSTPDKFSRSYPFVFENYKRYNVLRHQKTNKTNWYELQIPSLKQENIGWISELNILDKNCSY
jgi:hypothetical protein